LVSLGTGVSQTIDLLEASGMSPEDAAVEAALNCVIGNIPTDAERNLTQHLSVLVTSANLPLILGCYKLLYQNHAMLLIMLMITYSLFLLMNLVICK